MIQAKDLKLKALKGFAKLGLHQDMLVIIAQLAIIYLQIGQVDDAKEQLQFIQAEWIHRDDGMNGDIPYVLGRGEVVYMNSSGIALLIRVVRTAAKEGCRTFAYSLSAHYQKLFKMVGLLDYMTIYPDEYSIMERIEYKLE